MELDEYVMLVSDVPSEEVLRGTRAAEGATVTVETRSMRSDEVADAVRAPGVVAAARSMPITLVRPLTTEGDTGDAPAGTTEDGQATWGLAAVGALTTKRTGAGVTVAVLDTGINHEHTAFADATIVQRDFTGEGDGDGNGHGTHCAGTVFGGRVGDLRIGVAPGVERALIGKVLDSQGSGSTGQIVDGLLWAVREGANVVSMSLGLDFPGFVRRLVDSGRPIEEATSIALEAYRQNVRMFDSVARLVEAHSAMFSQCIVVAASGNESRRPQFAIGAAPPSSADGILSVGALGQGGAGFNVAYFSNAGPDLSAPGVNVVSAAHDDVSGVRSLNGTSMATPHVAGVAALWMEQVKEDGAGALAEQTLASLTALAARDGFAADTPPGDRGAGLVKAP